MRNHFFHFFLFVQRHLLLHVGVKLPALLLMLFFVGVAHVSASGDYAANVTLLKNLEYPEVLLKEIRGARKDILFSFYLFKISESPNNKPRRIAEELISARNRGVAVTVILEESSKQDDPLNIENRRTAALLSPKGIKVLFDSPLTTTHVKAAIIANRYVFLGSHNLTQSAMQYNNELSVRIDSKALAREIQGYLNRLSTH
jgi:phosphatidylserine/phosphatidylglycerophosphate/cardiolipin synthase-like enzyme